MKKILCLLLLALLTLTLPQKAEAAEFTLDPYAKTSGMDRSWYQGYSPSVESNTMTLCFPMRSDSFAGTLTASIALDDPNVYLLSGRTWEARVYGRDGLYPVRLYLPLREDRRNGDYPATITLKGVDEDGTELVQTFPYVIRIRDGWSNPETLEPVISDMTASLDVGSPGSLTLTISNPTTTLSMAAGTLTITDAAGEVLMDGAHQVEVPEILPGQQETITVPLTVKSTAAISQHVLEVALNYQVLGSDVQWKQSFTVPVTQAIRLEQGGVQLPTAIAGELGTMTLPLMNMGKGELQNVLVTLEMEDVLESQSVLVGTIAPGETKQAKLTFTPRLDSAGVHTGTVTVTCEDAYGNMDSQILDVSLTVDEPLPEVDMSQEEEEKTTSPGTVVLILLCVLLAAGLILQGKLLTGKLHKLEEERL